MLFDVFQSQFIVSFSLFGPFYSCATIKGRDYRLKFRECDGTEIKGIRCLNTCLDVMGRKVRVFDVLTRSNLTAVVNRNTHKSVENRTRESDAQYIITMYVGEGEFDDDAMV